MQSRDVRKAAYVLRRHHAQTDFSYRTCLRTQRQQRYHAAFATRHAAARDAQRLTEPHDSAARRQPQQHTRITFVEAPRETPAAPPRHDAGTAAHSSASDFARSFADAMRDVTRWRARHASLLTPTLILHARLRVTPSAAYANARVASFQPFASPMPERREKGADGDAT